MAKKKDTNAEGRARMRKRAFVRVLAEYLVEDQALMSIKLEQGRPDAKAWAKVRNETPLFGYPTVDEAEKQLAEWLGVK